MRLAILLALLLAITVLCAPALAHAGHNHHHDDEYDEFNDEEDVGYAATAAPYIPPKPEQPAAKGGAKKASFDDDEFEGVGFGNEAEEKITFKPAKPAFETPNVVVPFAYNWLVEIAGSAFLVAFGVNYLIGRKTNENLASNFGRTFREMIQSEFTVVGANGALLTKESQHTYRMNASGRKNCQGIQMNVRLRRRQDLLALLYGTFWAPSNDLIDIQIAMNNDALDSVIFGLAKNRDARDLLKEFPDLQSYTKTLKIPQDASKGDDANLSTDVWTAYGETKQVLPILDAPSRVAINKLKEYVRLIHITDQYEHKEYKKVLHLIFVLPEPSKVEELRPLLKMTFHLIDQVASFHLLPATKNVVDAERAKVMTEEKKEALEAKKEALEKAQLEKRRAKMANMDANQRAEFEEKERQRKMHKKIKKISIGK